MFFEKYLSLRLTHFILDSIKPFKNSIESVSYLYNFKTKELLLLNFVAELFDNPVNNYKKDNKNSLKFLYSQISINKIFILIIIRN